MFIKLQIFIRQIQVPFDIDRKVLSTKSYSLFFCDYSIYSITRTYLVDFVIVA